ncbi:hypothetical protein A2715_03720 [Candidatus Woesebacteria bacterium RIFCSPHIGHO2_01_FULL_39_32]|uniref:DOD-type homing endonuclease domain-containing protein n=2 Tax=Candidatus Woeseibacteriota TaxID=1752722 RepID=A0A1F8BKV7_9BACT|nr:MAG: hypothetical protein A2124_05030 [Candidatus Woesebacteria bacterium GWB1_37_5]OGM24847.1 MAG: hypothetical protein A2715_03720 [Candidatus Woesebacteria bacterium RIFCSPHIGHO2_01_FULL_39_32]OGM64673.1 MAG: hypothetical protein A2893_06635 [Candidatus Woesebacteria bacterium RIFCSPLOWO2_01_FULL_39_25]
MYRDPRGGHNRSKINEKFFKNWSPNMAYLLGLIYADGTIKDVRISSRTCYIAVSSNDLDLLEQVRKVLSSTHKIYTRKSRMVKFSDHKIYKCSTSYILRVGNKMIYQDLVNLGLTPRKSLKIQLPDVPVEYFNFFLRGYFDGDGCLSIFLQLGRMKPRIRITFTSGSHTFLLQLVTNLGKLINTTKGTISTKNRTSWLSYSKKDSIKILSYMYKNLNQAPYLERKYKKYLSIKFSTLN